ncbi:MAG: hypothetical protein C0483_25300 [Pirellula sp.]|nr:hypothetical protein [Pirellula sp.]
MLRKYQAGAPWIIPGGASAERVALYEQEMGFAFPEDFKAWVMLTNGPQISGSFDHYFGVPGALTEAFGKLYEIIPNWRDKRWIPIGGDSCGCYCAMATQQEFGEGYPIVYFDIDKGFDKPTCIEASDLQHFLVRQVEVAHLIRTKGIMSTYERDPDARKKRIQENDPAILAFHGARYPWEV